MKLKLITTLFILLAHLMLAGCPGTDSTQQGNGTNGTSNDGKPSAGLQNGGTLHLPLSIEPDDPSLQLLDLSDSRLYALARAIELPLVKATEDGKVLPAAASEWSHDESARTWTFTLKNAPGESSPAQLAEIMIENWQRILRGSDGPLKAQVANLIEGAKEYSEGAADEISGISLANDNLTISLVRPNRIFALWASQPGLGIYKANWSKDEESGSTVANDTGFGPFIVDGLEDNVLKLSVNPNVLGDSPVLDAIDFHLTKDFEEQLAMYEAGELHASNIPLERVGFLKAEFRDQAIEHETAATYAGFYDLSEFPWGEQEFQSKAGLRRSLNYIIDRPQLSEDMRGQVTAWPHFMPKHYQSLIPPESVANPVIPMTQRIEEARAEQILADHEQGNKLPMGMDIGFLAQPGQGALALRLSEYFREVTVNLQPLPMSQQELDFRLSTNKHEVILREIRPAYPDPDAYCFPYLFPLFDAVDGNYGVIRDEDINVYIQTAQQTQKENARVIAYRSLNKKLEDDSLLIFIGYSTPTLLISDELGGYDLGPFDFDASLCAQDFSKLGLKEN